MQITTQLRADAQEADKLRERSRALLVNAVRAGAAAGLTQRQIGDAVGRSQPEVLRLLRFHGSSLHSRVLSKHRKQVVEIAARHGARNVRVFGSVATGADRPNSDIDLLVDLSPDTSLFTLSRLSHELGELLGTTVDVVPADSLREHLAERVIREAVPL